MHCVIGVREWRELVVLILYKTTKSKVWLKLICLTQANEVNMVPRILHLKLKICMCEEKSESFFKK